MLVKDIDRFIQSTQAAVELPSLVTSVDSASEAHDGSKSDAPSLLLGLVGICQILERILVNLFVLQRGPTFTEK
jgi:hypothetical protein